MLKAVTSIAEETLETVNCLLLVSERLQCSASYTGVPCSSGGEWPRVTQVHNEEFP